MMHIRYRVATPADAGTLTALLREAPMAGWVRLQLLREPDYFAADALMGSAVTVLAEIGRVSPQPVGMCRLQHLSLHVNGIHQNAAYLGGLRIAPDFRRRLSILRNGFKAIRQHGLPEEPPSACFTSIACSNTPARRVLEASLPQMPVYRALADMHTLLIATAQGRPGPLLRRATAADIPALTAFYNAQAARWQFAPHLSVDWLNTLGANQALRIGDFWLHHSAQGIQACVALWDQRRLKQTVAHSYRPPLNALRPFYTLFARATGRVPLPAAGKALEQAYLAFFASTLDAAGSVALLREALWQLRQQGIPAALLGLAESHPLRSTLSAAMPVSTYATCIESVTFAGEAAFDLDGRPPQPEIALL